MQPGNKKVLTSITSQSRDSWRENFANCVAAEARQNILNQILHPEAADRLGRIRLVKESRARDVEDRLITLARTGQLRQKVTEDQLKELLNAVADNKEEEKIVVSRRKGWDDDDDDLLDL
jgi:DNA-binding TFAR19-related protein (PDSD5 family)